MRKTAKKWISLVAAATLLGSTLAMTACKGGYYKADKLDYTSSEAPAYSNGGFAVEKGDYIYYINGMEDYTASNEYGEVVKGSLMRIKKADLTAGKYDQADVVVPMLFVSQNYNSGIYIYGDYVYYATPTTGKNMHGEVTNSWIDFKRAKLDGTETMKDYYFRLSNNAAAYRFVQGADGKVYCLYEEDGALKSYNTSNGNLEVLVKGGTYYYDQKDLTNGNVYYTMSVQTDADTDTPMTATYNQVYCVNAAAKASVNADEASYTVEGGRTYDFDKGWMEAQNEKAKKTAKENKTDYEEVYDFDDYSTYPYVNLGSLVLDGVGKNQEGLNEFNNAHDAKDRVELKGYTYTLTRYENGGIYFTKTGDQSTDTALYYLSEKHGADNAVLANAKKEKVANNVTNASDKALFEVKEESGVRTHTYLYIADSKIYKATLGSEPIPLCDAPADATLWKTENGVLYYYAAGTHPVTSASSSGYNLSRIDYTGDKTKYENLASLAAPEQYKSVTISYVDFSSNWYKPEIFGDVLMYANAEAVDSTSYNYIYATKIGLADIKANNEADEAVYKKMNEATEKDTIKKAMTYYYRTGDTKLVEELYNDGLYEATEYEVFTDFVKEQKAGNLVSLVGKEDKVITKADKDAMEAGWRSTLPSETETVEEEGGMKAWQICLIVAASVVVVATAIIVPVIILSKKKAAREEAYATANAYKRKKIDTTDDKTIDVYADEEAEEANEKIAEAAEEVTEETVEETAEEAVQETESQE